MLKTVIKILAVWLAVMCLLFFFLVVLGDV